MPLSIIFNTIENELQERGGKKFEKEKCFPVPLFTSIIQSATINYIIEPRRRRLPQIS